MFGVATARVFCGFTSCKKKRRSQRLFLPGLRRLLNPLGPKQWQVQGQHVVSLTGFPAYWGLLIGNGSGQLPKGNNNVTLRHSRQIRALPHAFCRVRIEERIYPKPKLGASMSEDIKLHIHESERATTARGRATKRVGVGLRSLCATA